MENNKTDIRLTGNGQIRKTLKKMTNRKQDVTRLSWQ